MRILIALMILPPLCTSVRSQTTNEPDALGCVVDLELPQFAVAGSVPDGGSVEARVQLGAGGHPTAFKFDSTNRLLSTEVEYHLRERTVYRTDCADKEVKLQFTFKVEGTAARCPFSKVRFLPPNHFVITTQPVQSAPDLVPVKPAKPKPSKER
jgi:hypothetical protein